MTQCFKILISMFVFFVTSISWAQPSISDLLDQLKTAQGDDLMRVIASLGKSHDKRAVQPLLDLFDFPNIGMRQSHYIVVALGELKDSRAIPRLSDAWIYLKFKDFDDDSKYPLEVVAQYQVLRESIIDALGQIGGDKSIEILVSATRDNQRRVVVHACRALKRLKYKDVESSNCQPNLPN